MNSNLIVSGTVMSMIDNTSINEIGIPSLVLMERASLALANIVVKSTTTDSRILAICGTGNNGGDGACAARILHSYGYNVTILVVGNINKCTSQMSTQLEIAKNLNITIINSPCKLPNKNELIEYNIIIDALFGIGLSRNIEGIYAEAINLINSLTASVYSADIPSGINSNNGLVMNIAVKATQTITFGLNKIGNVMYPGKMYAGDVHVVDIGFPQYSIDKALSADNRYFRYLDSYNFKDYLPKRFPNSNKGTYGRVLVIAGSINMAGAAYFSAKAAYRAGAGLVEIFTCEENRIILQSKLPEAVLTTYSNTLTVSCIKEQLINSITRASSIVIGPGLGISDLSINLLICTMSNAMVPVIVDADALNILANIDSISLCKNVIFTPHIKEMSRLVALDVNTIKNNIINIAMDFEFKKNTNSETELILVLKDSLTIIADKKSNYLNTSGNNGMSTGGSGDVLTGIIAAYVAANTKKSYIDLVSAAVYVHGLAADIYVSEHNLYSLTADDLIDSLCFPIND